MDSKKSITTLDVNNFNLNYSSLIEASAGTGKTYTIITDENGTAVLPINLKPGVHPATAFFNGKGDYANATPAATLRPSLTFQAGKSEDAHPHSVSRPERQALPSAAAGHADRCTPRRGPGTPKQKHVSEHPSTLEHACTRARVMCSGASSPWKPCPLCVLARNHPQHTA